MSTGGAARPSYLSATSIVAPSPSARSPAISSGVASPVSNMSSPNVRTQQGLASQSFTPPNKQAQPPPPQPGVWRHPREEEILRRRNRTTFEKSHVFLIGRNILLLAGTFVIHHALNVFTPTSILQEMGSIPTYFLIALGLIFLSNIGLTLRPLLRKPDACEDIPLTPSQRHLFGLPPLIRPATPQEKEQWVTPPRYARSASGTPRSSSSSLYAEVSGSPLDRADRRASFTASTPFRSPSGSPLGGLQSHRGGSGERRRLSYTANRSSPLSFSEFDAAGSVSTPTKTAGHRASVGLNSKWLYEKGKASATPWGSGSVFL